ncbi:hypothetical protein MY3957_009571 [Beauveria namnaoensis]
MYSACAELDCQARPCIEKGCSKDDLSKAFDASDSLCGTGASQSLTTQPDTSTSAATDTPTSKSNPAATTSESASSGSESITTTSEHGASASRSATTTSTGRDPSGSLSATSTSTTRGGSVSSTGDSGNSEPHLSTTLPTTTGQSNSSDGGGLSKGATAGIGVGAGLGGIAVITGLAWFFYHVNVTNATHGAAAIGEQQQQQRDKTLSCTLRRGYGLLGTPLLVERGASADAFAEQAESREICRLYIGAKFDTTSVASAAA